MAAELDDFRAEVRSWFAAHVPEGWRDRLVGAGAEEYVAFSAEWLATTTEPGYAAPHVPKAWGGGGFAPAEQAVIREEWARAKAPLLDLYVISLNHVPGTLLGAGTADQQKTFVRDALAGTVWCQGFSEPDAGSDLASLRTRAVRDGDDFVVTGQKVWSSYARFARWCLLLARTDPDAPKHAGISYFILDMEAPGVEVRPIRQSTGHEEFAEIFLSEVRVPAHRLIGEENDGWRVAQRTLSTERGPLAFQLIGEVAGGVEELRALIEDEHTGPARHQAREEVARLLARCQALRSVGLDLLESAEDPDDEVDLSSVVKLATSNVLTEMTALGARLADPSALVAPPDAPYSGYVSGNWLVDLVNIPRWTVAGGSDEIQRNIVAERLLGLPREPRPQ